MLCRRFLPPKVPTMDAQKPTSLSPRQLVTPAIVTVRPFLLKPQRMNGLSERLIVSHYENNYGGAVRRLNAIRARLAALDWAHTPVFEINGLKREELIAAGSVILHEIFFESLGGDGDNPPTGLTQPPAGLAQALERDFGSVMAWRAEFTGMAKALAGGSGWVILAWSERLESVRRLQAGLQSFLSMRRIDARRKNASAFLLRFSQSLASRRQRLSQAMERSTIQRLGRSTNPLTRSERLTISTSRCGRTFTSAFANCGP
jgi:superoxide dismutase